VKLGKEDAELFFKLNWGLLFYANEKDPVFMDLKEPNFAGVYIKK